LTCPRRLRRGFFPTSELSAWLRGVNAQLPLRNSIDSLASKTKRPASKSRTAYAAYRRPRAVVRASREYVYSSCASTLPRRGQTPDPATGGHAQQVAWRKVRMRSQSTAPNGRMTPSLSWVQPARLAAPVRAEAVHIASAPEADHASWTRLRCRLLRPASATPGDSRRPMMASPRANRVHHAVGGAC